MSENCYDLIINGYDWGPGVDKIILHNNNEVASNELKIDDFAVEVEIKVVDWKSRPPSISNKRGKRTIARAYLCNEKGAAIEGKGSNIAIEMSVHPDDIFSNPFIYAPDNMNHWQEP